MNETQQKVIIIFAGIFIILCMVYLYWKAGELEHEMNVGNAWCRAKGYKFNDYYSNTNDSMVCCNTSSFNTIKCDRLSLYDSVDKGIDDEEFLNIILPLDKYRRDVRDDAK